MWLCAVLSFALALPSAATPEMTFSNVRSTYGQLGPSRPDLKVLPGELFYLAFDIAQLQHDADGSVRFDAAMEVRDPKGDVVIQKKLKEVSFVNVFRGRVPHAVAQAIGLQWPPGKYQITVVVADLIADPDGKVKGELVRTFEVMPLEFGIVRLQLTYDIGGQVGVSNVGTVGQVFYLNMVLVGCGRNPADNRGAISAELTVRDGQGKPTHVKPLRYPARGNVQHVPPGDDFWHVQFNLPFNLAGAYELEVKASDHVGRKTATATIPLLVMETVEMRKK